MLPPPNGNRESGPHRILGQLAGKERKGLLLHRIDRLPLFRIVGPVGMDAISIALPYYSMGYGPIETMGTRFGC